LKGGAAGSVSPNPLIDAHSVHGRLRWRQLSRSAALNAAVGDGDDFVEWVLPMR